VKFGLIILLRWLRNSGNRVTLFFDTIHLNKSFLMKYIYEYGPEYTRLEEIPASVICIVQA